MTATRTAEQIEADRRHREELLDELRTPILDIGFEPPSIGEIVEIAEEAGVPALVLVGLEDA